LNARILLIAIAVLALASVGGYYAWTQYGAAAADPALAGLPAPIDDPLAQAQEGDMVLGDPGAPVTMIEYSSLSCPHCARHHINVLPEIRAQYIDTGKVRLVMRDYPLNGPAFEAALLVHCVSPMAYWAMVDQLFATQNTWVVENSTKVLSETAAAAGISLEDFKTCLESEDNKKKILQSTEQAGKVFAVKSTPTFVINGVVVTGERSFDQFKAIFDALGAR
jgi:protein-disulfide isomerase